MEEDDEIYLEETEENINGLQEVVCSGKEGL